MNHLDDIAKNHVRGSALLFAGRIVALVINFAVQIVTVRYLAKSDYGAFAFAMSVVAVAAVVSSFGMDKTASRFLPIYLQNGDYKKFWGTIVLMFSTVVGVAVSIIVVALIAWGYGSSVLTEDPRSQTILILLIGLTLCHALDALFISLFAVLASPAAIFFRRHLLGPLFRMGAALVVVMVSGDVFVFAAGQAIAGLLGLAINIAMLHRIISKHREVPKANAIRPQGTMREVFGFSTTLLLGDLSFLLRSALVVIIIGLFHSKTEVAAFQAVMPIARLNELVLITFSILFLPSAAKLFAARKQVELRDLYQKTNAWVTLLSFPIFATTFLTAAVLPELLFGSSYRDSGTILAILSLGFFTNAALGTNLRLLRATGTLRTLIVSDAVIVAVAVGLNFWFVPRYGAVGGAYAVCGTYMSQALVYQVGVFFTSHINPFAPKLLAPYLSALCLVFGAMLILQSYEPQLEIGLLLAVVSSVLFVIVFARQLDLEHIFPEIARIPFIRNCFTFLPASGGNGRWHNSTCFDVPSTEKLEVRTDISPTEAPATRKQVRVAYIMSRFPQITETFVLREMIAVEQLGLAVEVFPLQRERSDVMHPEAQHYVERAFFTPFVSWSILRANLLTLIRQPGRYLSTLVTLLRSTFGNARYFAGAIVFYPKAVYFADVMKRRGISHVHAHFASHPAAVAFVIGRLSGIPYSFTAHGSDLHRSQHMLREKTREAASVIAISQYNREMILKECRGKFADKIVVIHCGIDPTLFPARTEATLFEQEKGPFKILCIGTLHEVKGQKYLIEACHLLKQRGIAFECHFLGGGPDHVRLTEQTERCDLTARVFFHGTCTSQEVREHLRHSDAVVTPSVFSRDGRREGIPVVLMEAMASGVPCVASRISGIPELVEDHLTGILTPPGDSAAIADALDTLAGNAQIRRQFAHASVKKAITDFHLTTNTELLITHFTPHAGCA